ncbi:hypothetical protein BDN70DRAFT_892239 [Pholiota conissans]|uniref:Uncharacterized protein n=1 Tax=Pholiota conissans TaxID=109636 RepID=A0A9P5Z793_9AGAR|nr:hypothetical protein BDN70DRAFT_892239 [Pholiota conissans]
MPDSNERDLSFDCVVTIIYTLEVCRNGNWENLVEGRECRSTNDAIGYRCSWREVEMGGDEGWEEMGDGRRRRLGGKNEGWYEICGRRRRIRGESVYICLRPAWNEDELGTFVSEEEYGMMRSVALDGWGEECTLAVVAGGRGTYDRILRHWTGIIDGIDECGGSAAYLDISGGSHVVVGGMESNTGAVAASRIEVGMDDGRSLVWMGPQHGVLGKRKPNPMKNQRCAAEFQVTIM